MQKYYDILGVDSNTTKEEVKKKFRKLSMQHHPDRGGDPKTFNKILEAYRFISNINKNTSNIDTSNNSADEFFKAMFGSKYGPYSRRN
jgi:curved DNA-binding protein CbpA